MLNTRAKWQTVDCATPLRSACVNTTNPLQFSVVGPAVSGNDAAKACADAKLALALPITSYEARSLALVAKGEKLWLAKPRVL